MDRIVKRGWQALSVGLVMTLAACQALPGISPPSDTALQASSACPPLNPGSGNFEPPFPHACERVVETGSGLKWLEITAGPADKASPPDGATVIVAYEGYLASDGTRIDSSYARGQPAVFVIEEVIEGWTQTLKAMTTGDEWLVYIPAGLAYGSQPRGEAVPANSDLVFKIRLDGFMAPEDVADLASRSEQPASDRIGAAEEFWAEFLPWDASRESVRKEKSGLSYVVLESAAAQGDMALADDIVAIDYEARIEETGEMVSATWSRDAPLLVRAGDLIPGFAQMISLMTPGDLWIGRIPAAIAYGKQGLGDKVPPGTDLVYLVNLIAVNPETRPAAD